MKPIAALFSAAALFASASSGAVFAGEPQAIALEEWVTEADNLPDAQRLGLDGTVSVELTVSPAGKVTDCRIVKSSGHSLLDEHTCRLMYLRGQFKPATDEKGRSVEGTFSRSVRWEIIANANWAANGFVRAEMIMDPASGQGTRCTAEIGGEISDLMKQMACFVLINQAKSILAALNEMPPAPFRAGLVLSVYPAVKGEITKADAKNGGQRVGYAKAAVVVSPSGMRADCRMLESQGSVALIFPICGASPPFRYVPRKDGAGANAATELRQEVAYYVVEPVRTK